MKKTLSILLCVVMICMGFTACSGTSNEVTEENIAKTVEKATKALQNFDTEDLGTYVDSSTLSVILNYAKSHDQFESLGKAIFENLQVEIKSIDTEAQTVTISVLNKDLENTASVFAEQLKEDYSTFQLLAKLSDDNFLDLKLNVLTADIDKAEMKSEAQEVTLSIQPGSKNLVLIFDSTAEDAVSGGALSAIKNIW